jgi:hypothetical protein
MTTRSTPKPAPTFDVPDPSAPTFGAPTPAAPITFVEGVAQEGSLAPLTPAQMRLNNTKSILEQCIRRLDKLREDEQRLWVLHKHSQDEMNKVVEKIKVLRVKLAALNEKKKGGRKSKKPKGKKPKSRKPKSRKPKSRKPKSRKPKNRKTKKIRR